MKSKSLTIHHSNIKFHQFQTKQILNCLAQPDPTQLNYLKMATEDSSSVRLMQIKILYSLDNQPNVYLSRSENTLPVKVVQIPLGMNEDELITLGGLELQDCVKQVVRSAPDTFNLNFRDFEVYYQDISEQPDEPFVANGVISKLLHSNESCLVPGRVCQSLEQDLYLVKVQNVF